MTTIAILDWIPIFLSCNIVTTLWVLSWSSLNFTNVCVCLLISALKLAGIEDLFDVVLGNEDYKEHKPKPDAFITAASRLGVNPEDCWGFEDT